MLFQYVNFLAMKSIINNIFSVISNIILLHFLLINYKVTIDIGTYN